MVRYALPRKCSVLERLTTILFSAQLMSDHRNAKCSEGLDNCPPVFGDSIERTVEWTDGPGVSRLAGEPVRLRIVLRDADLYAFQFGKGESR